LKVAQTTARRHFSNAACRDVDEISFHQSQLYQKALLPILANQRFFINLLMENEMQKKTGWKCKWPLNLMGS
jgi:hypothetical protein